MTAIPRYLLPDTAEIAADGRLLIGGVDVVALVETVGTPVFIYDEAHLRARCREAATAFPSGAAYASKAFLCRAMAQLAHQEGMLIDVSTAGELHVALDAGVPANRLVLHGNNKSDAELTSALTLGVHRIVVDSFAEIDRLALLAPAINARVGRPDQPVLVRVTPGVHAHTHTYVMTGQEDSKFGFSIASGAAAEAMERLARLRGVEVVGVHAHIGSQIFDLSAYDKAAEILTRFVAGRGLRELCIGGGLGVAYVAGETAPSITEWAATVRAAFTAAGLPSDVAITAEPGRSVVASAAITLYRVGTIKELPDIRTYVAVDGGMSDNPRPVLYGSGYETFLPRVTDAERPLAATLVGKHCESGDVIVTDACLPADLAVDDIVATPVTGAYGHSMSSTYNKVPRAAVVFVRDGDAHVVVRRESLADLTHLDADLP
ncbi:MAG TPA: diaminopimelate decarboxylase [Acidimicrobiales bacterium]|nr:diaminopimelate decarboxylase [Acidimicrobiales bacterium]